MASGKQPSRDARQHGEKCRVLFSRPNKPRHRHGTVLQGGNAGNSILSFRNAILTFSFQSYHLAAQSCRLMRHPIIWFLHSIPIICNPILFVTPPTTRPPRASELFFVNRSSSTYLEQHSIGSQLAYVVKCVIAPLCCFNSQSPSASSAVTLSTGSRVHNHRE